QEYMLGQNDLGLAIEVNILDVMTVVEMQEIGAGLVSEIRTINYSDYQGKQPKFSDCYNLVHSKKMDSLIKSNYDEYIKGYNN
ncbi:MAG: hypothetical protein AAF901_08715, partial [Bacteroidota bacterium]